MAKDGDGVPRKTRCNVRLPVLSDAKDGHRSDGCGGEGQGGTAADGSREGTATGGRGEEGRMARRGEEE